LALLTTEEKPLGLNGIAEIYLGFEMVYSELVVDIGLVITVIVCVAICCSGTLIASFCYIQRRTRPREDSGESLV